MFLIALAAGAFLRAEEAKSSYSITVDFPYVSKYTFRGVEMAKDSIQPSIEVAVSDAYIGVWTNQPVTRNIDNEFDFYAGYKFLLNDQWNVDVGTTLYYYPELETKGHDVNNTTIESYVGVNGDIAGVKPGAYVYYDWTLETWTAQGQVGYSIPLKDVGVSLDLSANAGRVFVDAGEDYNYWALGTQANYALSEKATVYAGVSYTSNDLENEKGNYWVFTVGLSIGI